MNILVEAVNLFVVPFISVHIYIVRMNMPKRFSFDTMALYAFFTPLLMLFTRAAVRIMQKVFDIEAAHDSVKYTAFALATAVALPFFIEILKKSINIECTIKRRDESR